MKQVKHSYIDFEKILNIAIELSTEKNTDRLMADILEKGMQITRCDAATLYLYQNNQLEFKVMKTISLNVSRGMNGEKILDVPPVPIREENVCAYAAIHRSVLNIADVNHSSKFDFSGPRNYDQLTGYHTKSMLVVPLTDSNDEILGVLQMLNAQDEEGNVIAFDMDDEIIIRSLGSLAAIAMSNLRYQSEIKRELRSFVEAMATAIDEKFPYNGAHTRNVARVALLLAEEVNEKYRNGETDEYFDSDRKEKLELAALFHDIGKIVIPRSIMNRAKRLDDKDLNAIKERFELLSCYFKIDYLEHSITKEEYESRCEVLQDALDLIAKIDGHGYLEDEDYEAVQCLASRSYVKKDGSTICYLTDRERECLSIRSGTLTDDMRQLIESHVDKTAKLLSKVYFTKNYSMVPKWAEQHHEFLDGTGYPKGLKAEDLSIEVRILTITDIYDALTSRDRPYKKPVPSDEAIEILYDMAEQGKIDKILVQWLKEALSKNVIFIEKRIL